MRAALIAIQLEVSREVLASADVYRRHLEDAATRAVTAAGEADARLVVFPELAGHLALLALAPPAAHRARTLGGALAAAAVRRPLDVLRGVASSRVLAPRPALLAALAPDGERFWRAVFGPLARRLGAHVVAGSHLRLGARGDLTNASLLFLPDGRCAAVTDKVNLVPGLEDGAAGGLGLARGVIDVPIAETALGRVATLVCYDGFTSPHTTLERFEPVPPRLVARGGVTVVANPAANPWPWLASWPPPTLAAPASNHLTRAEQWQREGLPASLARHHFAHWGITAHLVGRVLDLAFEGTSEILQAGSPPQVLARAAHHDQGGHVVHLVDVEG
jgi:predicted amidohydrolase